MRLLSLFIATLALFGAAWVYLVQPPNASVFSERPHAFRV